MNKVKFLAISVILIISGCASSSDLEKTANNHAKAGNYYESVGQPNAANDEYNQASKTHDNANGFFPIVIELFNLFTHKDM
ncbi:hypothetical protein ACOYR1_13095 [Thalassotalea piscium]